MGGRFRERIVSSTVVLRSSAGSSSLYQLQCIPVEKCLHVLDDAIFEKNRHRQAAPQVWHLRLIDLPDSSKGVQYMSSRFTAKTFLRTRPYSEASQPPDQEQLKRRYLSAASAWEIGMKHALGRLPLPAKPDIFVPSMPRSPYKPLDRHHPANEAPGKIFSCNLTILIVD